MSNCIIYANIGRGAIDVVLSKYFGLFELEILLITSEFNEENILY